MKYIYFVFIWHAISLSAMDGDAIVLEKNNFVTPLMPLELVLPLLQLIKDTINIYRPGPTFYTNKPLLNQYAELIENNQPFFNEILPLAFYDYSESLTIDNTYIDACNTVLTNNTNLLYIDTQENYFKLLKKLTILLCDLHIRLPKKKTSNGHTTCKKYKKRLAHFETHPIANLFIYLLDQRIELYEQSIIGYPLCNKPNLIEQTKVAVSNCVAINRTMQDIGDNFNEQITDNNQNETTVAKRISIIDPHMDKRLFEFALSTQYDQGLFYLSKIMILNHLGDALFILPIKETRKKRSQLIKKKVAQDKYGIQLFISTTKALRNTVTKRLKSN